MKSYCASGYCKGHAMAGEAINVLPMATTIYCHIAADDHCPSSRDTCRTGGGATEDPHDPNKAAEGDGSAAYTQHSWFVSDIDCPSCISKVKETLKQLDGLLSVQMTFATLRLTVEFDASRLNQSEIEQTVIELGYGLSDVSRDLPPNSVMSKILQQKQLLALGGLMIVGGFFSYCLPDLSAWAFWPASIFGLLPIVRGVLRQMEKGHVFGIETLMTVAVIGALVLGESFEAAMVVFLFMIGEKLEGFAADRARTGVKALMMLTPDTALLINGSERREVMADSLNPKDIIEVRPGDRLPVDADLMSDRGSFDESALTGESLPVERMAGDRILAGSVATDCLVQLRVQSKPGENAIDRILSLIEEAETHKAPVERFIDRFSRWYTPMMMMVASLVVLLPPLLAGQAWDVWIYRGLALLLIACPCALIISTPAAVTSALAAAARKGILVKGGAALEQLADIRQVAFDKTGTLTLGKPDVTAVISFHQPEAEWLSLVAAVEKGSNHPLALAILAEIERRDVEAAVADHITVLAGHGVVGTVNKQTVRIGSPVAMAEVVATMPDADSEIVRLEESGNTVACVSIEDALVGLVALSDTLRTDSREAIDRLSMIGVGSVMLTGDNARTAAAIARQLNMDFQAELLPEDKVHAIRVLQLSDSVAMVGDGINDAPALRAANIGIAMGKGSDVALETADAALTHDRIREVADVISLSRRAMTVIYQNITLVLALKVVFLVTSLMGITGLMIAVLADSGATVLVTANALRLLRKQTD